MTQRENSDKLNQLHTPLTLRSVEVNFKTVKHFVILCGASFVGLDKTYNREGGCEDKGGDWQDEPPCQDHAPVLLGLIFVLVVSREDLHHIHLRGSWSLEHLIGGVKEHLHEGNSHCEEHPDVDHLDIRGHLQALGESQKSKNKTNIIINFHCTIVT